MRYLIIFACFLPFLSMAQNKSYVIGAKGDTLNRIDRNGLKQGRWVVHVDDLRGERGYEEEGVFVDGNKEGTWRRYSLQGDLIAMENFRWGQKDGRNIYFNYTGEMEREEGWRAVDPKNPYDTVNVYDVNDPNKIIGKKVVKLEVQSVKHGTWKYYNTDNGTIAKEEEWIMDKPANQTSLAVTDDLAPIGVASNKPETKKTVAKPKEVLEFEKKNSGKKKVKMRDGSTGY